MNKTMLTNDGKLRLYSTDVFVMAMCLFLICLPLGAINIGAIGSALKIVALIPTLVFVLCRNKKLHLHSVLKFKTAFILWIALSIVWSIEGTDSISYVIRHALFFVLIIACSSFEYEKKHIEWFKSSIIWSSRITVVLFLLFGTNFGNEERMSMSGLITEDPNYLCGYFIFGIIAALDYIVSSNKANKKIINIVELIAYAYAVFITGSRGGAIAILISVFFFFTLKNNSKNNFRKLILLVLLLGIIYYIYSTLSSGLLKRFTIDSVLNSNATGRFALWYRALYIYENSSLFKKMCGNGLGTIQSVYGAYGYKRIVSHNVLIDYLVELGIIGIIIYLAYMLSIYLKIRKMNDSFATSVFIGMATLSMSISITTYKPYWNIILFIIVESLITKKETVKTIETI